MMNNIKRILCAAAVFAFGFAAQTASASAASVRPMTFDECGTTNWYSVSTYDCMYISGGGLSATEVRGWATTNSPFPVHVEVLGPNDKEVCNSPTYTVSSSSQVVGCQIYPNGADIPQGQYCSIVWQYTPTDFGHEYVNIAERCGTVSP